MAKIIGATLESKSRQAEIDEKKSSLPGFEKTEKLIEERPSALEDLKKEIAFKPTTTAGAFLQPAAKTFKGLGLVQERLEGGLANPLMELQEAQDPDLLKRVVSSSVAGFTGKRRGQFGDVSRRALPEIEIGGVDIDEALSAYIGLGTAIGLDASIAKGAQNLIKGGKGTLRSLEKSFDLAKKTKSEIGAKIGDLFDSAVGGKKVSTEQVHLLMKKVPKKVLKKILDNPVVFKVKKFAIGGKELADVPATDAKNVWRLRQALEDSLTSKELAGKITKKTKGSIKSVTDSLRGILSGVDEKIGPLMEQYSNFVKRLDPIEDLITDKKGRVVVNKVSRALKSGEPRVRLDFEDLGKSFNGAAKMMKQIDILNRNRALVKAGEVGIKTLLGLSVARKFFKPGGGGGTVVEQGGS